MELGLKKEYYDAESPSEISADAVKRQQASIDHQEAIEDATLGDKFSVIDDAWRSNTYLYQGYSYLKQKLLVNDTVDRDFLDNTTQEDYNAVYADRGIPIKYWERMQKPNNIDHMEYMIQQSLSEHKDEQNVQNTLNSYGTFSEANVINVGTGFVDADMVVPFVGVGLKLTKLGRFINSTPKSIGTVTAADSIVTVGSAVAAYQNDPDISLSEAAGFGVLSVGINAAVNTAIARKNADAAKRNDTMKEAPSNATTKTVDDVTSTPPEKKTSATHHKAEVVRSMAHMIDDDIQVMKNLSDEMKSGDLSPLSQQRVTEMNQVAKEMVDLGMLTKADAKRIEKGDFESVKIKFTKNKDGSITVKGSNKKIPLAVATVLTGTALSADDGDAVLAGTYGLIIAAAIVTLGRNKSIFRNAQKFIGDAGKAVKATDRLVETGTQKVYDVARSRFFETTFALKKDTSSEFRDFANKMVHDSQDGAYFTAERDKSFLKDSMSNNLNIKLDDAFSEWKAEQQVTATDRYADIYGKREQFDHLSMEAIEFDMHVDSKAIQKAVTAHRELNQQILKEMQDAGVKASAGITVDPNYMRRKTRTDELGMMLREMDDTSYTKVLGEFRRMMIAAGMPEKAAIRTSKSYVKAIRNIGSNKALLNSAEDMTKFMKEQGANADDVDKFIGSLGWSTKLVENEKAIASQFGATQHRIALDKRAWQPITVQLKDGTSKTLGIDDIFINSATEISEQYILESTGHIALANAGFTVPEAYAAARKGNDAKNVAAMEGVIDTLIGTPRFDMSVQSSQVLKTISDYTIGAKMKFSVISQFAEAGLFLSKANVEGMTRLFNTNASAILKAGTDSEMVAMVERFQLAADHKSMTFGTRRHIADDAVSEGGGAIQSGGEAVRDASIYALVRTSGIMREAAFLNSLEDMRKFANGKLTIPKYMQETYGINDAHKAMLKKYLVHNDKGFLKAIDWDNMPKFDADEIKKIADNMTMKVIQTPTLGGTPDFLRANQLGSSLGKLLTFAIQSVGNHGVTMARGIKHKDPRAAMNLMIWVAGGYASAKVRDALKGKERSEDEYLREAILSVPGINALELPSSLSNPVVGSTVNNYVDVRSMLQ